MLIYRLFMYAIAFQLLDCYSKQYPVQSIVYSNAFALRKSTTFPVFFSYFLSIGTTKCFE